MQSRGYKVYVLNPRFNESIRYNPMYYATDSISIDEMAEILIKSANPKESGEDKVI